MLLGGQSYNQNSCAPKNTRKSFKGVENFLRKVAFNLGNSPSQTEVKIISCIPIDVTDLQERILLLEKELEIAKAQNPTHNTKEIALPVSTPVAHATIHNNFQNQSDFKPHADISEESSNLDNKQSNNSDFSPTNFRSYAMTNTENPKECNDCTKNSFFSKKKRLLKKKIHCGQKHQFVYYAQTEGGPFENKYKDGHKDSKNKNLEDSKQCKTKVEPLSEGSQFSSPVLKDVYPRSRFDTYESDVCSCCRGKFQNIDNHMVKPHCTLLDPLLNVATEEYVNNRGKYYDSTLYDLIPVKEKTNKNKKDTENNRKEFQDLVDMLCYPQDSRIKSAPHQRQYIVNYQTVAANRFPNKRFSDKKFLKRRKFEHNMEKQYSSNSSKCCYVQCGSVYAKRIQARQHKHEAHICKDVNCSTSRSILFTSSKNNECQTTNEKQAVEGESKISKENENKTEETLNQIKTILQTVLNEVKSNAENRNATKNLHTKDATVQKGSSQSNVPGCSKFSNNCTYSPYNSNLNAEYIQQMPHNYYYQNNLQYPGAKCQQYPVFVHATNKHICNSHYKHPAHVLPPADVYNKKPNKGINAKHSTETNKLIKEIYKSLALDGEILPKDTEASKTRDVFKIPKSREVKTEPAVVRSYVTNLSINSRTLTKDTITNSSEPSVSTSLSTNTDQMQRGKFRRYRDLPMSRSTEQSTSTEGKLIVGSSGTTKIDEESETGSDSGDSVVTTTQASTNQTKASRQTKQRQSEVLKEKKDTGIFQKVMSMFKGRKSKISTTITKSEYSEESSEESETDSDYQTICREPVTKPNPTIHFSYPPKHIRKSRNHSKLFSSRSRTMHQVKKEKRRKPHSNLDKEAIYMNGYPYKGFNDHTRANRPVYYQSFDARSAICDYDYQEDNGSRNRERVIEDSEKPKAKVAGFKWLKKQKEGVCKCGEEWKKFLKEN